MILINQLSQRSIVKRLIAEHSINLIHQPIPVSPRAPSFIHGFGVPVVIGPMNGGMNYPAAFRRGESLITRITLAVGRASSAFVNRLIPGKRRARVLLVANERTRLALPGTPMSKVVTMVENGVDLTIWSPSSQSVPAQAYARFIYIGRLVDWKRLDLVLDALVTFPEARFDVVGDGPMRDPWAAKAISLGMENRVSWLGWLSQSECADHLRGATALVLPSIYECGGAVVLEAMACGTPAIALDWGGPADYVDEGCGVLIEPSDVRSIVKDFSRALHKLADNAELRAEMGRAGRLRVEKLFDWEHKIDLMLDIYLDCLNK